MTRKVLTGLDLNNQRIQNMADGSSPADAVTLQQLQAAIRGLDWKDSVKAATTASITLSATQTVDGVSLVVGDRVLVKDQSTASQNGIYTVASGAWARSSDADTSAKVTPGMATTVEQGTVNADRVYILTTDGTITLGTTALAFTILGGGGASYTGGNGIQVSGGVISVNPKSGGGITVDSTGVSVDTSIVARRFSVTIGDGSATSFTISHNFGHRDVIVAVRATSNYELVEVDDVAGSNSAVTLTFASAPASGAYRVTVVG